jgi:hypothetical protein
MERNKVCDEVCNVLRGNAVQDACTHQQSLLLPGGERESRCSHFIVLEIGDERMRAEGYK